ncbi:amino acid ABC transporter permease [Agrobacterium leguminum]|uniref:Polar amino acid ABC transporter, inner membrane subunit n=1 Tax=Brucella anthropi (strain ATCC 49188 / DSM 6882 / CCUG 24695 / JCM 21032 / LMG 3331 / NBRC 15819 / NCTC 12168 / Alc 37) TaxID=439375 RepID=A6X7R9_BRUA4|nr:MULTISPECIES: amino acid ABC transporter permease [Hyphomicrobiales]ABS17273.1 polar amino acid ABC transporter, inner membrane subunit [Brucella anthropi ATCC 49188]KAB2729839.1 amino acid ABC transporter permease [Brucella anthropi]MCZ7934802.1 amino acid ABC transporter permease [Agrobacterium leguminum]MCZ7976937.1 amino acid ABC transporter permease [Agrobacterium salinitolerans]NKC49793.1 amino acid ABC transporter permease [Brucella anthropi ATCC 49188]
MQDLDFSVVLQYGPALLKGLVLTLQITVLCGLASVVFGFLIGVGRKSNVRPVRWACSLYVEVLRGTPVLITLFWVFFCFPIIFDVELSPFISAVIALTLYTSAITSESFRAALGSIGQDQHDACKALGLSRFSKMMYVVAPQTIVRAIPNLMSNLVSLFKESALVSAVGVVELMYTAQNISNVTARPVEVLTTAALVYFVIGWVLTRLVNAAETRLLVKMAV